MDTTYEADGWGWRHAGRHAWAVKDATFRIEPGSKVLLIGGSGSGKSTLLHGMAGLLSGTEGEHEGTLTLGGRPVTSDQVRSLVGLVQQDPDSQIVMDSVGDEVAFGCENLGVPREEIWRRVEAALETVGLDLPLDHPTDELSGGQKQRLALAAALAMESKVLLLDEPTANLDPEGIDLIHDAVKRATDSPDMTLVIIEHRVETWVDLVDRVIVLDHGRIIADGPPETVLREQAEQLLDAGIWVPGYPVPIEPFVAPDPNGDALTTNDLSIGYQQGTPVRNGLDARFRSGLSTCIVGGNGSGKTTLGLTLAGLLDPLDGNVAAAPELWEGRGSADPNDWTSAELLGRIAMVFQEPSYQFLTSTVADELYFGLRHTDLSEEERDRRVADYLERMQLTHLAEAHPLSLSGGEKRRLSVGSALITAPPVVILDEPTFGQDRNTWISLVNMLRELVERGRTIISITHDRTFIELAGQDIRDLDGPDYPPPPAAADEEPGKPTLLQRVNPVVLLIGLALMTFPLFLTVDIASAAVALALVLLILPFIGWTPRQMVRRLWPVFVAAPLAAFSMLLYAKPGGEVYWSWGPASITQSSVDLSIAIALRVLALGIPALVILTGTKPTAMADALTQTGRLPARPVLATLAGVRLVALMLDDWHALQRARRSRGVREGARVLGFFKGAFALFTFAMRRAGTLSITMEARGFGADTERTHARLATTSRADAVMILVSVAVPVIALGVALALGTFRWFGI